MKQRHKPGKITTPVLESIQQGLSKPVRKRGKHWLSSAINRLRFDGASNYSKRRV